MQIVYYYYDDEMGQNLIYKLKDKLGYKNKQKRFF